MTPTLSRLVEPYLVYCRAELLVAQSTQNKYAECFRTWIVPVLGEIEVPSMTPAEVTTLRSAMVSRRLSVSRQYSVLVCLKGFLKFCRLNQGLNVLDPAKIKLPSRRAGVVQFLTNSEVARLIHAIDLHTFSGMRLRAMVELLLSTGLRISEALSLDRSAFDADADVVEIVGKGGRRRTVYLSERCRAWAKLYLAKRLDDHPALFVTTGYPPRRFRREDVSRFFIFLRRKAEITKHLTPHLLRHTFCTNLLHNGADIAFIRDLAGHTDIQTTARCYLGSTPQVLRRVVAHHLQYDLPGAAPIAPASPRT